MVTAPRWCLIISSRKSRSNATPSAPARLTISSAVSMPGMGWKPSAWCASTAVTSWPRSRSQSCIISISSSCESSMRSAVARMASLAVLVSSSAVISRAWAWCEIMPCMNRTSASVNRMPARSEASAAEMVRLGSPGAPGWTMGGCAWAVGAPSVRSAAPTARATRNRGRERCCRVMGSSLRRPGSARFPGSSHSNRRGRTRDRRRQARRCARQPEAGSPRGHRRESGKSPPVPHGSGRRMPGRRFVRYVSAESPSPGFSVAAAAENPSAATNLQPFAGVFARRVERGCGRQPRRCSARSRVLMATIGGTGRWPAGPGP